MKIALGCVFLLPVLDELKLQNYLKIYVLSMKTEHTSSGKTLL